MKITMHPVTAVPKIITYRNVAAYCRVSTQQEIQHHSLEAQREYYENKLAPTLVGNLLAYMQTKHPDETTVKCIISKG